MPVESPLARRRCTQQRIGVVSVAELGVERVIGLKGGRRLRR